MEISGDLQEDNLTGDLQCLKKILFSQISAKAYHMSIDGQVT